MQDWARLHRYASWMRALHISSGDNHTDDTLLRLSSNSPGGLLFPKLESLDWDIDEAYTILPFFRLFLSPHLQRVALYAYLLKIPERLLAPTLQVVSLLPTFLEYLSVTCGGEEEPLRDALSSPVCRFGSSLRGFKTSVALSEAAIDHLMQLPNLSHWTTSCGPPVSFQHHFSRLSRASTSTNQRPYRGCAFSHRMEGASFGTVPHRRHRTRVLEEH